METLDILRTLLDTPGVVGFEEEMDRKVLELIGDAVDEHKKDPLGNLYAIRKGSRKLHIAFFAHTDELGMAVTNIDEAGFISFMKLGGIDDRILPSSHVIILGRDGARIPGVIGLCPPHLKVGEDRKSEKTIPSHNLFIDIGVSSREEAMESGVEIGLPIVFKKEISCLENNIIACRGMDNRAGCAALVKAIMNISNREVPCTVTFVFSTQEEYGLRGAQVAAFRVQPDYAVAVDSSSAPDFPGIHPVYHNQFRVGKGPMIRFIDTRAVSSAAARSMLIERAERHGIPWQPGVIGGSTDAAAVQVSGKGTAVVSLCIPCRYTHSRVEAISLNDLENAVHLITQVCEHPPENR
jgi:endoglucanase